MRDSIYDQRLKNARRVGEPEQAPNGRGAATRAKRHASNGKRKVPVVKKAAKTAMSKATKAKIKKNLRTFKSRVKRA